MRSSKDRKSTTRMTQATKMQLNPALSRQTCHRATRWPQQGFSQLDLMRVNTQKLRLFLDLYQYLIQPYMLTDNPKCDI